MTKLADLAARPPIEIPARHGESGMQHVEHVDDKKHQDCLWYAPQYVSTLRVWSLALSCLPVHSLVTHTATWYSGLHTAFGGLHDIC